jgi:2-oxoglutarate dehydrogenase E1 component
LAELASGGFRPVLGEVDAGIEPAKVTRLVFCSGRVYFDLAHARKEKGLAHVALLRVEQYYPLPDEEIKAELVRYPNVTEIVWAQDEPQNQGAWRFMAYHLKQLSSRTIDYAGRPASASPATGYHSVHKKQLDDLIAAALGAA